MKIRNHKKIEYYFYPEEDSTLKDRDFFKTKKKLMNYLNGNFPHSLNGTVYLHEQSRFSGHRNTKCWSVWYNNIRGAKPNIILKKIDFRDKSIVSKINKKYFAFSDKIFRKMIKINKDNITVSDAKKLVDLFYKAGFKDFVPDEDEINYINGHISSGIDFYHWSDRCDFLRMKVIIEYFKRNELL